MVSVYGDLWRALELTEHEQDKHASIVNLVLNDHEFDVNELKSVNKWARAALHVACGRNVQSHVGAQLLLADERCDVNLQDGDGRTPLMTAVRWAKSENDKHVKIVRLLLDHPRIKQHRLFGL